MISPRRGPSVAELIQVSQWAGGIRQGREWDVVERTIGTSLPDDYKEMMNHFPSGFFRNAVFLKNPIDDRVNLENFAREEIWEVIEILGDENLGHLDSVEYALFPEFGGLLPWGNDLQGGIFCWLTKSADPNLWPVAYYSQDLLEWIEFSGGIVEMIWEVLTHAGDDNILRRDLDHELPIFRVPSTYVGGQRGWIPNEEYR